MEPPPPPHRHKKCRTAEAAVPGGEEEEEAKDALISLPPDVLDGVLTRLGLRDAVRTSALSRAWRRRWESLPSLDISFPFPHQECSALGRRRRRPPPLPAPAASGSFSAYVDKLTTRRAHDWILVLARRGVESLDLASPIHNHLAVHSSVFSCDRLAYLNLFACDIPPLPPGFAGFPNLRSLTLDHVWLRAGGEYQLEEIIENSPLLEMLVLSGIFIDGDDIINWVIRAPNLQHLTICSPNDYGWNLLDLPRLRSAVIDLWDYLGGRDFAEFLGKLLHVRKLHLFVSYQPSNGAKILETLPCTFDSLKSLKSLKLYMDFCELPAILTIFCLLRNAPNLEKLKIMITDNEQKVEANGVFQNAEWTGGMCANLQIVQITRISWLPNEMSFIELILSKASLLRTISVTHGDKCLMSNEDALSELLKYKRASPQAQILFKVSDIYAA
ncbi:hypothetical protein OsJ_29538 [Oryza sativa Japonica Group]|uniref:F-box domain-containing protein n=1 Tax=Oryza sativa subsp. japonica TaxID=39947 RepID=B9G3V7_ORYSJ|nr:hypothetical protein OsJ_29538 [Oryza sativa Japonica Group]